MSVDEQPRWGAPAPIKGAANTPRFPVDTLPDWCRGMVDGVSEMLQVPVDAPAMMLLSTLSAACSSASVQVRPGFRVTCNVYTATAMPPGARKSPVYRRITDPIVEVEAELRRKSQTEVVAKRTAKELARKRADDARLRAQRAEGADRAQLEQEAVDLAVAADMLPEPVPFRLLVDDITPERLATKLGQHDGRLALLSEEGGIFDMVSGRYSTLPSLDVYLKGADGGTLLVDRTTGDREDRVVDPRLTIGLMVQPQVLQSLGTNARATGRGLVARFLMALPPDNVGFRTVRADPIDSEVEDLFRSKLQTMARTMLDPVDPGDGPGASSALTLHLTPEADDLLAEFESLVEEHQRPGQMLRPVVDWSSKLPGKVATIAGLLHMAEGACSNLGRPIEAETMERAITIGRWAVRHFLAVNELMGVDDDVNRAEIVLDLLRAKRLDRVSKRDLFNMVPRRHFPKASCLDDPLRLLVDRGHLWEVPQEHSGRGRPPSPVFLAHPCHWQEPEAGLLDDTSDETDDEAA